MSFSGEKVELVLCGYVGHMIRIFQTRAILEHWNYLDSTSGVHRAWRDKGQVTWWDCCRQEPRLPSIGREQASSPEFSVARRGRALSPHLRQWRWSSALYDPLLSKRGYLLFVKCRLSALHSLCQFLQYTCQYLEHMTLFALVILSVLVWASARIGLLCRVCLLPSVSCFPLSGTASSKR